MSKMPTPLTARHFARVCEGGEWVCLHPDDAPQNRYLTVHVYQGNHELDRYTIKDAVLDTGIDQKTLEAAFTSPAPKPGDYKPKKADKVEADKPKAEKPAAKKAAAKADK